MARSTNSPGLEHELLALVLDLIPFFVFWKDRDSRYLGCNRVFSDAAGLDEPSDILGLTDYDLPWAETEADDYRADDAVVIESESPKLHIIESQLTHEGTQVWLDTSKVPLRDKKGRVIGVVGIYADITAQRENELELRRTRAHLDAAIQAMDSAIVLYDAEERFVFCNEKYRRFYFDSLDDDLVGKKYETLLTEYTARHPEIEDAEAWVQERIAQHRRCEQLWLQELPDRAIQISDMRTEDGGVVSVRTDVTEHRRVQEELRLAKEAAEAANAAKSAFLANMSHEIRTPMAAILGFTDVLLDEAQNNVSLHALHAIKRNGESLLGLINDILDLSKVEAGKLEAELRDVSPCEVLSGVVELMSMRAHEGGVTLDMKAETPIPRTFPTDGARLRQILVNLVSNAVKFSPRGSVTIAVRWDRTSKGGCFQVRVTDTGIGMSPEQVGRVFSPFEQADSSTTRSFGGTGLGLAISARLAELLNGQISVTSELGVGSVFCLSLDVAAPVQLYQPTPAGEPSPGVPVRTRACAEASQGRLDGWTVLLADDGRDNQFLITRILNRAGAKVEVADDGQAAVDAVVEAVEIGSPPHLILMDMQMPRLDGYGATLALREQGHTMPIIALTANAMAGDRELCLAAGCDDYLAKPVHVPTLIETCRRLVLEEAEPQPDP